MTRAKGEGSIYRRPDGYWAASVELPPRDGKRRRKVISSKTKATVIKKLDELKRQLEDNGDLHTDSLTVEKWLALWLRDYAEKTRRPKTVGSYRSVIDKWVVPTIGKTRLDKLTPATIRRVFAAMEAAGLSSTYMRNTHAVMSAAFKDAEREERIRRNPVDLVEAPRKRIAKMDELTVEEATELIAAFAGQPDAYLWATFLLTGARRGEVLGLEWDRVTDHLDLSWQLQRLSDGPRPADFEYRQIEGGLYWTRPKTQRGWRIIPLVDPLRGLLERWRAEAPSNPWGLVFTRPNASGAPLPVDPDFASRLWPDVRKAAGITKDVPLHGLRHTTAALLYAADVDEDVIEAILGHSTAAMSRHYRGRVNRDRLEAAMRKMSAAIGQ